ncbi:methyltransferase, FkbM family [Bradyrhizobium lablabi]|uniref:Methyltransferase, FkbM family n=1 Tax=Bradyrhizobium lablabi TaxID=722472 RepID=A0A1M6MNQ3_9BRAD|nr:FkbM family methyltransferase [Bradyrhizobium lablabi]SHJ85118.1 methyltransferase, FkbM family [Bradyrhizobium lablabi]
MKSEIVKAIRTLQCYVPALQSVKEDAQTLVRRVFRIPHESDFRILKSIDFDGKVFVDVGANRGQSIESARTIRPDIRIVSFEPQPSLVRRLKRIYGDDQLVEIRDVGLSDTAGSFTIYTPIYRGYVYHGLSSLDRASASKWLSTQAVFGFDPEQLTINEESCRVRQLDNEDLAPAMIKIDVQGTEGRVLRGAVKTVERYKPVIMVERDVGMNEVREILKGLNYSEYRLDGDDIVEGSQIGDNAIMMTPDTYDNLWSRQKRKLS